MNRMTTSSNIKPIKRYLEAQGEKHGLDVLRLVVADDFGHRELTDKPNQSGDSAGPIGAINCVILHSHGCVRQHIQAPK